ncbi:glycosyltransferase family 4 protein [Roseibium marinum]|uniref:Glycosyltransferase involved in cell wall biosynthesis n=1 Tax=Roseibium marinum TaxID=281252 RepID=A0A2S3UXC6_9HYPH|nr:glycosyltransferase family 4 protein [Roseibium marinum]POF32382.1 glycosyltransferase involved in cell wall biosynthesis [Roseibium marinum]
MKIAFTAPMKPLDHPVPSGDRTMGRLMVKALEAAGHEVTVASTFRSWRKDGSDDIQGAVKADALRDAERIAGDWQRTGYRPDLFLTYHLYHKAPDWIGPALADRFGLPYAIVEASRAPKRKKGDWAFGFAAADAALRRADAVAAIHNADAQCLSAAVPDDRLEVLLPFLDTAPYRRASEVAKPLAALPLKLLAVGMMREGDKTRSYEVLAEALAQLRDRSWQLTIIGDGPNSDHVLKLFPPEKVAWLGALPEDRIAVHYARHDLLVWPAIREAYGLVLLEAQAAGIGIVAGNTFGVPDIVIDGETSLLSAEGDADGFAANLERVLDDPSLADRLGHAASRHIESRHSLEAGAARLDAFVRKAVQTYEARAETAVP